MARHNLAFLLGAVVKKPNIVKDAEGNPRMALAFLNIVRGYRDVGDKRTLMKSDRPIIMSKEPDVIKEIDRWEEGDIVEIKGTIATTRIKKSSTCDKCGHKNSFEGVMVYVNPFFVKKRYHYDSPEECMKFLSENREVSNQVFVFGTLVRDPKKMAPKVGLIVTQYQIAMNRKFRIRTDAPDIKADYPWVKSYGENAQEDWERLYKGSEVFIDGCMQARGVMRHAICSECGEMYDWKDRAMEIVPYATEYINGYRNDEEIEENRKKRAEQAKNDILKSAKNPFSSDNDFTEEDIAAGIDQNPEV